MTGTATKSSRHKETPPPQIPVSTHPQPIQTPQDHKAEQTSLSPTKHNTFKYEPPKHPRKKPTERQVKSHNPSKTMTHLETLHLEHLPPNHEIHIALYRDVKNAAFLHSQLLAGNGEFEYALIDASVILSRVHVLAAVYRAIHDARTERMKSRNVHSEVVFSLSPNNNIAESFRRFGIIPTTTSLLIVKISLPSSNSSSPLTAEQIQKHLTGAIEGEAIPFSDEKLAKMTDLKRVRKVYKLNSHGGGGGKKRDFDGLEREVEERRELEVLVLGAMALRGSVN